MIFMIFIRLEYKINLVQDNLYKYKIKKNIKNNNKKKLL